ncbi:MAG TPA: hypothetical protein VIG33_09215 [Pseudobdellovibrionaceae bacterium]|jgi:hypothetical protein
MRFLVLSFSICSLLSAQVRAQEFASEEPQAQQRLDFDEFENVTKLLYAGKLAPHMKCDLKVRTIKEERKFSDGKKLVEVMEVIYYPRGLFADLKVKVLIPAQLATFGLKYVSNQWSGAGEDIKIEAHDSYDHWLRFMHDGKGNIVQFSLGNSLATYPCLIK